MGVALLRGEALLGALHREEARLHSETLLPAIDALLRGAGVALEDVGAFAVSVGPGSFTGLRIGIATLKGLAFGTDLPVAPVPTLAALCPAAGGMAGPVGALLDARRGEVYAAVYAEPGSLEEIVPGDRAYRPEALAARLPEGASLVVGEGAAPAARALARCGPPGLRLLAPERGGACAERVGRLGQAILAAGGGVRAEALRPRYVRRAEAEVQRTGRRFEA